MGLRKRSVLSVEQLEDRCLLSANVVLEWNQQVLDAIRQTNTNPLLGSRALAITQAAVYDAVNAIDGAYAPYAFNGQAPPGASPEAAAAVAAYHTLVELFPTRQAVFDAALASSLAAVPDGPAENQGAAVGRAAAESILALRRHDGFDRVVSYTPGTDPGDWQPTPPAFLAPLGPQWPLVTLFAMTSGSQFRPEGPPDLGSEEYATAFNEVKSLGRSNSTTRTEDQTVIARFWADGAGTSFAFGHWNIIAQEVVSAEPGRDLVSDARLLALLNLATADAIISCWDAKYAHDFWRPVTAIRAAATDGNLDTTAELTWTPLLGTPNFPSYTSGHSTVSAAAAAVLTDQFGSGYHFTTGSEGLAGVTREFDSFDAAAAEAGQSRIYGGIHFQFENIVGQRVGVNVGKYVVDNYLLPPAAIESVVINDGSAQRSMVNSLTITFDRVVTLDSGAFGLQRKGGSAVSLNVVASVVDGRTIAVLTFTGSGVIGGSLADGNYTLTIRSDLVRNAAGRPLDGNGDGIAGGDRVDTFFRLYGDSDGDRDVDLLDLGRFLSTLGRSEGDRHYLGYMDVNGDDRVGLIDLFAFVGRLGTHLNQ